MKYVLKILFVLIILTVIGVKSEDNVSINHTTGYSKIHTVTGLSSTQIVAISVFLLIFIALIITCFCTSNYARNWCNKYCVYDHEKKLLFNEI
jgi:hypothetical protein